MRKVSLTAPSEKKIRAEIKKIVFGKRVSCPNCHRARYVRKSENRYRCQKCRKPFSVKSVTWLSGMNLSWKKFWLVLVCFCLKYQPDQAVPIAGVSLVTIRFWYERIRKNLPEKTQKLILAACVDEAYFGKRKTGNQRIVAGAITPYKKDIRLQVIPNTEEGTLEKFIETNIDYRTLIFTDRHPSYNNLESLGYGHETDNHAKNQLAKTVPIERVWAFSKWHIRRMYHHVWANKLPFFLREIEWRFSTPETFENPLRLAKIILSSVPNS